MTNREKYLKDGVEAKELWKTFQVYYYKNKNKESDVEKAFRKFFEQEATPTLTEDERVILRNINSKYIDTIHRNSFGELILHYAGTDNEVELHYLKENLFQFIKERRRI